MSHLDGGITDGGAYSNTQERGHRHLCGTLRKTWARSAGVRELTEMLSESKNSESTKGGMYPPNCWPQNDEQVLR